MIDRRHNDGKSNHEHLPLSRAERMLKMKIDRNAGVEILNERLEPLRQVLAHWTDMVSEYSDSLDEDACYWYNERANVGVLASAAWRTTGWVALEEYQTVKRGRNEDSKNGRCDLFLHQTAEGISFALEAKQAWQNIGKHVTDRCNEVRAKFRGNGGAWSDSARLDRTEASIRLAACFVVPRLPASQVEKVDDLAELLDDWKTELRRTDSWGAFAWVFPKRKTLMPIAHERVFPGVCLVIKQRHRT